MSIKLYEINELLNDSLENLDLIEDEEERNKYELEVKEQVKELILQKSNNLIAQNRYFESSIETIDNEIERLKELKKRVQREQGKFFNLIDFNFKNLNVERVDTDLGTIKYRNLPLSVEIVDEDIERLPKDYIKEKITYSADKMAIKKLYKEQGIKLPNVVYHENESKIEFI